MKFNMEQEQIKSKKALDMEVYKKQLDNQMNTKK